ncbi:Histidine--tRNA ligase [Platanthera guangdongensis]|uniref:Histidine--tRNA ligase n=1 Tax=Platanthera guangdongensis TaxID=2320717 RepID=A0ABR2LMS3_9ASPA
MHPTFSASSTSFPGYLKGDLVLIVLFLEERTSESIFHEFSQRDFDIGGHYSLMLPDYEVIKVLIELLYRLNIGDYEIKLNHIRPLDEMLAICGVSSNKFRTACSRVDKLDKMSFEEVKKELVEEKRLAVVMVDMIGASVNKRGSPLEVN